MSTTRRQSSTRGHATARLATYLHLCLVAMLLAFLLGIIGPARDMLRGLQEIDAGTTATSDTYNGGK